MTEEMRIGPFDQTWFCNEQGYDIRRIKPYSAYDVGADSWVVKPPHLPHWSLSELPKPVQQVLRAADSYARHVLKLPEPERTQQGAALFEAWHTDRSRAFSERGEGWWDIANLREKFGDQAGWWAQLVDCAHRAKQGLDAAPADWSNIPTGYVTAASRSETGAYPSRVRPGSASRRRASWTTKSHRFEPKDLNGLHALHVADEHGWAGSLSWNPQSGTIDNVEVRPDIRRQGLASHLWEQAKKITPHLQHDSDDELTEEGRAWASKIATIAKLPKTQKCDYCEQQATKRVIWAEGMAYIPVCDEHEQRAKDHVGDDYCNTRPIAKVASSSTMYHWAPQDARDDIAEHGLDHTRAPGFDPAKQGLHGVFLHHNEDLARDWVPDIERTHDLYAVDTHGLSLRPDPYDTGDASYTERSVPPNRLRRISMMEAPEEGPLPHSPGRLFYRVHPVKRGWSQENASSQPFGSGGPYGDEGEELPREHGYSAFDNPHDLGRYLNAMNWHRNLPRLPRTEEDREEGRPGRIDPHQIRVVQLPGEIVGHGHDGEHLVRPHARADRQEMDYETFRHRLRQTPHPDVAYHWHKSPYEQVPEWAEGNGHDCDPGGQGNCHNDYSEEAHETGMQPTHHWASKEASAQLWITPQLVMGSAAGLNHARQVNSASEAVAAVQQGLTAVLPSGAWFPVRQVLLGLGMSLLDVTQRLKQFGAPSSVTG